MIWEISSPKTQGFLFKVNLNNCKSIPKNFKVKTLFDGKY